MNHIACSWVSAVASGLFQGSTLGFAGILPQKYTAAVMGGQASCSPLKVHAHCMICYILLNHMPVLFCTHTHTYSHLHTHPLYTMQAFAGIFAVMARIISSLIPSSDPTLSTLLYFSLALAVVVVCLVSFFILVQLVRQCALRTFVLIIAHKKFLLAEICSVSHHGDKVHS